MTIATTVQQQLAAHGVPYDVVEHRHAVTSLGAAHAAHVPPARLAKCVILEDEGGFLMAVVPSDARIELGRLQSLLHRRIGLATEEEVAALFQDCEIGAVPPIGSAYGMEMVVEERLCSEPEVYIEAGDHRGLIHLTQAAFADLVGDAARAHFSRPLSTAS
jgi:Ala-tRNA(Pro) deacylase